MRISEGYSFITPRGFGSVFAVSVFVLGRFWWGWLGRGVS